jgi:protein-L-isoaspartate(D-aspartate) O-methyltransferase
MTDRTTELRQRLVDQLTTAGYLTTPAWVNAFAAVPREKFVHRYFIFANGGGHTAVEQSDDIWLEAIYQDRVLPTQLDGDPTAWDRARRDDAPADGVPTCSLSQPSLTAVMLEALDVHDGHRVLEVGAGTGYNAALLAHRLGDTQVTTIDVDPVLTADAARNLTAAGYAPTVVTGDGEGGVPQAAPYDRIIATCSLPHIPATWLTQTRPGGMILTNLYRDLHGGPIVLLTVNDHGTATGPVLPETGGYMPTRTYVQPQTHALLKRAVRDDDGEKRHTDLAYVPADEQPWHLIADITMPGVTHLAITPADAEPLLWLVHDDGSWAVHYTQSGVVEQRGPRKLWDELESAHDTWSRLGKPTRDCFGLTVGPDGQHVLWLDEPESDTTWSIAGVLG